MAAVLSGIVTDRDTGKPLAGVIVAAAPYDGRFDSAMAGDAPPHSGDAVVTDTAADGSYDLLLPDWRGDIALDVFGAPRGYATYHGIFAAGVRRVPALQLLAPTAAERRALDALNAFRRAPGGVTAYGARRPLIFVQNLLLAARYWAAEERGAQRIGHTCAQLGHPRGCIEYNAFFHALPGAPQADEAGQNVAFDPDASWDAANRLFEDEGDHCGYDWRACPGGADGSPAQTGHFVNLMAARRWIGLGEALDADGGFFAQNLL